MPKIGQRIVRNITVNETAEKGEDRTQGKMETDRERERGRERGGTWKFSFVSSKSGSSWFPICCYIWSSKLVCWIELAAELDMVSIWMDSTISICKNVSSAHRVPQWGRQILKNCCTYANLVQHASPLCGAVCAISFTRSHPHPHLPFFPSSPLLPIPFHLLHPSLKASGESLSQNKQCEASVWQLLQSSYLYCCCCCIRSPTRVDSCGVISFDYMPRRRAISRPSKQVDSTAAQIKWQTQAKAEGKRREREAKREGNKEKIL